ncbi:hypothetical protein [Salinibacterium sp. SWN1162]|uniref:hypothetical protein n=1 Tax=Salinibacterium sp. SWN1162 TaxID=2792053 RepID=UPI0018CD52FF|nr:hypothetical protein [Salinibacterium sp. SWN1162]MBH0009567.1 hypothetical protein [Salinibacterium sp. SWN1162]
MTTDRESGGLPGIAAGGAAPLPLVRLEAAELMPLREAMRDLQRSLADYYAETARGGDLGPRVRSFLVAAQTLNDLLTNSIAESGAYKDLFAGQRHPAADFVDAVKFARNVSQHVLHIVRPSDEMSLVGGSLGMRVYAVWDDIPAHVVAQLRAATRKLESAYQANLEGHEVTGTMMSVLRFYAEVSPEMVHRDARNEWTGFPLLSQPGMNSPLHPEEPAGLTQSRHWMDSRAPGGDCRVVCGQTTIDGTSYVYGQTFVGRHSFAPFAETVDQANYDIGIGYPYLDGNIAANFDDVTDRFPEALQGSVIASRGDVLSWAAPIARIDLQDDWHGPGINADSWTQDVKMEIDTRMPEGFRFGPRRARRLNALVPPR